MNRTRFRQIMQGPQAAVVDNFLRELEAYQSYSTNKARLRRRWHALDAEMRDAMAASPAKLRRLWRGADGMNAFPVTSWTPSKSTARTFGYFVFPVSDLISISGSIDTSKVRRLVGADYEIGDDEGEVILVDPVWRSMTDAEMRRSRRA